MGRPQKAWHDLSSSTQEAYAGIQRRGLSPRVRMALRMYETAAVPTKAAAARAVGLDPQYFYLMTSLRPANPQVRLVKNEIDDMIRDRSVNMSVILEQLGRRAVGKIHELMNEGSSELIQLKSAQDLADRAPSTSKTVRAEVTSVSITSEDAKELAAAMVEGARAKELYRDAAEGDYIKVDLDAETRDDLPETPAQAAKALAKYSSDGTKEPNEVQGNGKGAEG